MPRPGQVKFDTDTRLSDRIAIGLLTRSFPSELVDRVITETGRTGQRDRLLSPQVVVYFVLAMCLFSGQGYEEVARLLTEGLSWAARWPRPWRVPTTAAISRARVKLGPAPLKALFEQVGSVVACAIHHRAAGVRELSDRSYLSQIVATDDHYRREDPVTVRVVEYTLDAPARPTHDAPYRLITTVLDHRKAPARELAALYLQRWEIETALDELKTHRRGPGQVLWSRSPDGVEQEVWAQPHSLRQQAAQTTLCHWHWS